MPTWRGGAASSERELHPTVCTPPREGLPTAARLVETPRDSVFREEPQPSTAVTQQACSIVLLVACVCVVALAVLFGLYAAVSTLVSNEVEVGHCPEQPVTNGYIKAGFENSTAEVQCNPGYRYGTVPAQAKALRCSLLLRQCITMKAATAMEDAMLRCTRAYGFTLPQRQVAPLPKAQKSPEEALAEARIVADGATLGVCVPPVSAKPSRLYGATEQVLEVATGFRAPARVPLRWTSRASSMAMAGLMLVSLVAVVLAGVGRAKAGAAPREPDTAISLFDGLSDAEDEFS